MIRHPLKIPALLVVFGALLPAHPGCGGSGTNGGEGGPAAPARRSVVLITVDTLRADHVGVYGSSKAETPAMDRLARDGVMFHHAAAAAPLTLPSHASLFTGTYTLTHGVRDNVGFALPGEELTLAEMLREGGWQTAGFVSAYVLDACFGIAQGFDLYSDRIDFDQDGPISPDSIQRDGRETLEEALSWLENHVGVPFFVWIHFFDPHSPYTPPEPFATRYPYDPYAAEVAYTDSLVGRLMDGLGAMKLLKDTIIVLAGDHGEGRGDHQERYHGLFVYESTIRVPLIIKGPGIPAGEIRTPVRLIDIMPTILDLLGLGIPERLQGESLMPLFRGDKETLKLPAYAETSFPILHYGWSGVRSLRAGNYKYIHAPEPELYDLASDPDEEENIAGREPQIVESLKKTLLQIEKRSLALYRPADRSAPLDGRSAEALRLLGYTGTVIAQPGEADGELPDPKDKVDLLLRVSSAERALSGGQPEGAVKILDAVLSEEPRMLDARISLGAALQEMGDYERAVSVLEETTKMAPDLFVVWANLGMALRGCGREGESLDAFKRAHELDPSNVITMGHMIDAYFRTGRFRKGVELCSRYLERDPESVKVLVAMGMGLVNMGRYVKAKETVERAIALDGRAMNAWYILGKCLEAGQDFEEAAAAYEQELASHEGSPDVYHSLAGVYQRLEKPGEAVRILQAAVRKFPEDPLSRQKLEETNRE